MRVVIYVLSARQPHDVYGSVAEPVLRQFRNRSRFFSRSEPRAEAGAAFLRRLRLLLDLLGKQKKSLALVICKYEVSSIYKDKYDPKMILIT